VPEGNVEIVRAWMSACNGDDAEHALALCDPSIEMIEPDTLPGAAKTKGIDGVRRYFAGWTRNWSEWRWEEEELEELPPDKVLVVAQLRLRGLRSGIWVEHRWAYVFTVRDGKLVRQQGYDSRAQALAAVQAAE
jgi:ketosteroid isomerase-like protein